jgi:hypothetical protein
MRRVKDKLEDIRYAPLSEAELPRHCRHAELQLLEASVYAI